MRAFRITVIAILLSTLGVGGAWADVRVEDGPGRLEIVYNLPTLDLTDTTDGLTVGLPGRTLRKEAGRPELPLVPVTVSLTGAGTPRLEILEHRVREIPVGPLAISRGHVMRDRDPGTMPRPAALPTKGVWPAAPAEIADVFTTAGRHGATVRLQPVRHDAARGVLVVTEHIRVALIAGDAAETRPWADVRSDLFTAPEMTAADKSAPTTAPRMLIVAPRDLGDALVPFMVWKTRRGMDVAKVIYEDLGATSAAVQAEIAQRYHEPAGLTWVLLVGDQEQIPALAADASGVLSDQRYAMIDGDDLHPDVLISRLPARTFDEARWQADRCVAYERDALEGDAWYARASGVASAEGSPADHERADAMRDKLLEHGFTSVDRVYESDGAGTGDIRTALEAGRSFVTYLGHGSGTSWQSVPFGTGDVDALGNDARWPWIVDASCNNGDFAQSTCLAESWLRAGSTDAPAGAVGVFAATNYVPWTPPIMLQNGVIDALTVDGERSLGALCHAGLSRVLEIYGGLPVAAEVVEQYVLFGDASLDVRTTAPNAFVVGEPGPVPPGMGSWSLAVDGPAGSVVALSVDGTLFGRGVSDGTGLVEVVLLRDVYDRTTLDLTVTGPDMTPHMGTVFVSQGTSAVPEVAPIGLRLQGNHPNPFNPSTTISFATDRAGTVRLTVYDLAGRRIRDLLAGEHLAAGEQHVTWDGRDTAGRALGSGVYLYRVRTSDGEAVGRMTLAK